MSTHLLSVAAVATTLWLASPPTESQTEPPDTFDFGAQLSGAQEVVPPDAPTTPSPGVATQTTGTLQLAVAHDLASMAFRLVVQNGVGVTASHLHCGRAGQNGPIVVALSAPNAEGQDVNGVLAEGTATNANIAETASDCEALIGRPIRNIAALTSAAAEGLIYANVHTVNNPAGELRGQVILGFNPVTTTVPAQ